MKQLGSRFPRCNDHRNASRRAGSKLLLRSLMATLLVGLSGCKSSHQISPASAKAANHEHTEMAELATAIADLRNYRSGDTLHLLQQIKVGAKTDRICDNLMTLCPEIAFYGSL
jgi:hypothetical protein